jgi:hypothetical protein
MEALWKAAKARGAAAVAYEPLQHCVGVRGSPQQDKVSKSKAVGVADMTDDKIEIENFTSPGRTELVNRAKFEAMRDALLAVLPQEAPGLKVPDAKAALLPLLPDALFPQGATAGWWLKAVQLDLEAKEIIQRAPTKPVQLYRVNVRN